MFWKKNVAQTNVLTGGATGSPLIGADNSPAMNKKEKKLSKKDIIMNQVEALQAGQVLRYKFPDCCGGDSVVVELDSKNSDMKRNYILSMQKMTGGKPDGKLDGFCSTDKPKQIAEFVLNSDGEFFGIE